MEISRITDFFRVVAFLGALAFVVRFTLTRWWQTWIGRCMMGFVSGCVLLLGLSVMARVYGVLPSWVRLGSFMLLSVMMWSLFVALMATQRRGGSGNVKNQESPSRRSWGRHRRSSDRVRQE